MGREVLIDTATQENRVAIMEDNRLVELIVDKKDQENLSGNIYKGIIKDILPGLGAAFVDIGLKRTAFLHYKDISTDFLSEFMDTKLANKKVKNLDSNSSNIGKYLRKEQEIVVQVKRSPLGQKGAKVVCRFSIPGRFLVLLPHSDKIVFSKKIVNRKKRQEIKKILEKVKDNNFGFIVRTEAKKKDLSDFVLEYTLLKDAYHKIVQKMESSTPPTCLYSQNNLENILLRDIFRSGTDRIIIDNKSLFKDLKGKLKKVAPELVGKVELYKQKSPLFGVYNLENEIDKALKPRVCLPSGGNIMIEQTEALVVIDVNSGSFISGKSYDNTIKIINKQAAVEAIRQIRIRNLGGIIIIDFIDMEKEKDKLEVYNLIKEALKKDSSKSIVSPFTKLGLVEISRKRFHKNLLLGNSFRCPTCLGVGNILKENHLAIKIKRSLKKIDYFTKKRDLDIVVHPSIKDFIKSQIDFFDGIKNKICLIDDIYMARDHYRVFYSENKKEIKIDDLPRIFDIYLPETFQ